MVSHMIGSYQGNSCLWTPSHYLILCWLTRGTFKNYIRAIWQKIIQIVIIGFVTYKNTIPFIANFFRGQWVKIIATICTVAIATNRQLFSCYYWKRTVNGPLTRYLELRLLMHRECREHLPRPRLQRKPLVNNPGMHHSTCVTHVPWCMSGSLVCGGGENVTGIPGACAIRNFTYLARGPCHHPWDPLATDTHKDSFYEMHYVGWLFTCYGSFVHMIIFTMWLHTCSWQTRVRR